MWLFAIVTGWKELKEFVYKKMYGHFARIKRTDCNNERAVNYWGGTRFCCTTASIEVGFILPVISGVWLSYSFQQWHGARITSLLNGWKPSLPLKQNPNTTTCLSFKIA